MSQARYQAAKATIFTLYSPLKLLKLANPTSPYPDLPVLFYFFPPEKKTTFKALAHDSPSILLPHD
jgi:hypothetical protein